MKKSVILKTLLVIALIAIPVFALAAPGIPVPRVDGLPGSSTADASGTITNFIVKIFLPVAGIIAILFIIIGGFQYMLSGANEDLAKKGKTTLTNAIIGLIIVILSYLVVTIVVNTILRAAV